MPFRLQFQWRSRNSLGSNFIGVNFPAKFEGDFVGFCNGDRAKRAVSGENDQTLLLRLQLLKKKKKKKEEVCNKDKKHWFGVNDIIQILSNAFPRTGLKSSIVSLLFIPTIPFYTRSTENKWEGKWRELCHAHFNVLCDLVMYDGTPDLTSPKQLLKAQLNAVRDRHGLVFKSAFEYEFKVMKEGTMEYLGGPDKYFMNTRGWDEHYDLFCDLTETLREMGVEVSALMQEFSPGQWEVTTDPEEGVRGGDVAFYTKNAVKGFFKTHGYHATFMTRPRVDHIAAGLHVNHSLWTVDSDGQKSVMQDKTDPDQMSSTARHWLTGILTHAPAITALCCPTLNCYRRLFDLGSPGKITWGVDNRNALVRVRNSQDNVFFENRLPSGSCCPYLALAATVAAGLDRKLECPQPMDVDKAGD